MNAEPVSTTARTGNSPPVRSNQAGPHPRLREVVQRHQAEPWREPLHAPTVAAFEQLHVFLSSLQPTTLVLDSGCGTGASTRTLAQRHPGALVIGVDKSLTRLSQGAPGPWPRQDGRCIWVRAELSTFWRLAGAAGWALDHHYLLYPNPWPKPGQLLRRWHAHPAWPCLLALGGTLVMRCNWALYAEEFELALDWSGWLVQRAELALDGEGLSPFERKYRASGHRLFEVRGRAGESGQSAGVMARHRA